MSDDQAFTERNAWGEVRGSPEDERRRRAIMAEVLEELAYMRLIGKATLAALAAVGK